MSYSIGFDRNWNREVGYGVPSICDHPDCNKEIDRGLSFVCGGEPYGGEDGCGLFFCKEHLWHSMGNKSQRCERCIDEKEPFDKKPDTREWIEWKLTNESWKKWREKNPDEVEKLNAKT